MVLAIVRGSGRGGRSRAQLAGSRASQKLRTSAVVLLAIRRERPHCRSRSMPAAVAPGRMRQFEARRPLDWRDRQVSVDPLPPIVEGNFEETKIANFPKKEH